MGGTSFERDFSLKSGKLVCDLLEASGHEVMPLDADSNLVDTLRSEKPDVAFVTIHGAGGEDGSVPSLLEFLRIPYVGSRPPVCRASWNKSDIPFVMRRAYGPEESVAIWPAEVVLPASAFRDLGAAKALDLVADRIGSGFPLAVKPACGGSAMGVSKVEEEGELGEAIMAALAFDDSVIIQEWVDGVELSVAVIGEPGDAQVLPPVEIHMTEGLYDTSSRIDPMCVEHFCPVRPESLSADGEVADSCRSEIERAALEVFEAFGCRDMARVDMIWDGAAARILDLKVFPGLTDTSLVPMAVSAAGIDMADLLDEMVACAYERGC
ncbi:MAG: ATP-grasp domain-containing protein [Atopobiaceae bacterium]|nr:ATP-grasp domain-containing protein [Atopobiaceae bacterium]